MNKKQEVKLITSYADKVLRIADLYGLDKSQLDSILLSLAVTSIKSYEPTERKKLLTAFNNQVKKTTKRNKNEKQRTNKRNSNRTSKSAGRVSERV